MSKYQDQIPDYLDGLLTPEERADFEEQLRKDTALQEQLEAYQSVRRTLSNKKLADFREKLDRAKAAQEKPSVRMRPRRWIWMLAASILLLLAAGLWLFAPISQPTAEELMAAHFEQFDPEDILPPSSDRRIVRGDTLQQQDTLVYLERARILFRDTAYAEALEAMQNVPEKNRLDAYFYELGILHLLLDQPEEAIKSLNRSKFPFEGGKQWYLALSHLKLDQKQKCIAQLNEMIKSSDITDTWKAKARKMLKTLQ